MKKYITTGVITLQSGVIALSDKQALKRKLSLTPIKRGIYQIEAPVQFKIGEEIGFDKTPKAFLGSLFDPDAVEEEDNVNVVDTQVLIKAMFDLEEGNTDHFTDRGLPRVGAVKQIVGFAVTADQCNEAWKEFQKG